METKAGVECQCGNPDYAKEFEQFLGKEKHLALMVRSRAEKYGDTKVAVRHKLYGQWEAFSWAQFGAMINDTAMGLIDIGVGEGDFVGIFAANSVYWAVADFASFTVRAASVPVYATNSARELEYVVNHAGIRVLFVGDQSQYDKAMSIKGTTAPALDKIIVFDKRVSINAGPDIMYLEDFIKLGHQSGRWEELQGRIARLESEDLSTLIYTSGTTGTPKGVMLTHRAWLAMLFGTGYHIPIVETDVNLAFLPLSHVFERAWSYFILCGCGQVDYCHDTKALEQFLKESRPHYMCSVPRLWEKIYAKVREGLETASPLKRRLFEWSLEIGGQVGYLRKERKPVPAGLAIRHSVADKLVLSKIRAIFGGRSKVYNCGGAAFSGEISEFFFRAGVLLLQGYGLTECFVICVSNPERNKFGTCGPVVPLVDIRFSEEGEILGRGPNMMSGYYREPDLTRAAFTGDGYVRTGDVGYMDEDGFIVITDRIKDLMKTSGGKYIAPQQIETLLKEDYYFEQVAVVAEGRKYVAALIVPFFEGLENWARREGVSFASREDLVNNPRVLEFYRSRIDEQTKDLGQVEKVKKFTLLANDFTQEGGEMTPTQKIKRNVINKKYADIIESMY